MNTLKNALSALRRNKGRNAFISMIMLVIITISCIALIINNTANTIRDEQKAKYGSKVTIQLNDEAMKKYSSFTPSDDATASSTSLNIPSLENDLLMKLSKSKYVKDTIINTGFGANSDTLKPVEKENQAGMSVSSSVSISGGTNDNYKIPDFNVRGYSLNQENTVLASSNRTLIEGTLPKDLLECMISDKLAAKNNLKIGDTIQIKAYQYEEKEPASSEMKLTISGFYQATPSSDSNVFMFDSEDIYMQYDATIDETYHNEAYVDTTYYLNSPSDLQAFDEEARSYNLPKDFKVTTDEASYQQVVGPIEGMAQVSFLFLLVVLSLGGALLVLLTIMNIRDRNYEIGILRSLGMRKQHVILQMIVEPILIVACMFVIGCALGTLIAQPISDNLLASQIKENEQSQMGGGFIMVSTTPDQVQTIQEMQVSLNETTIIQVFAISTFLILLSGMISSLYIVRYEPMEILSERR